MDHVQIAIPPGAEDAARAFYVELLGFTEIDKPPLLQPRGGAWFRLGDIELHAGVDPDFSPAAKAHPGFVWDDIDELATRLAAADYEFNGDDKIEDRRRFHTHDPFGNRLEFVDYVDNRPSKT
ncbi:MAG: VOC family protein [Acidimicrobiia bacterium]